MLHPDTGLFRAFRTRVIGWLPVATRRCVLLAGTSCLAANLAGQSPIVYSPPGPVWNSAPVSQSMPIVESISFESNSSGESLARSIEVAIDRLDAERLPDLDDSIDELGRSIERAKTFLRRGTGQSNYQRWLDYLQFDGVGTAIESESSPDVLARESIALRYRLVGLVPGLELSVLRNTRDAASAMVSAARFRNPSRTIKALEKEMSAVAKLIRQDAGSVPSLSPSTNDRLAELFHLLQDANQVPGLVSTLRDRFSTPNIRLMVSDDIITAAAERAVNQVRDVNDCILGTRVVGTANVNGRVTADLLPRSDGIRLQLTLNGQFASRNLGYNGPVVLRTTGRGSVMATRTLDIDFNNTRLGKTFARVAIDTDVLSITPKRRLGRRIIRKIAAKRVAQQKPQADRIAADRLRIQVAEQFIQSTSEAAGVRSPNLLSRFTPQFKRLAIATPTRHLYSTDTEVVIESRLRRDDQFAAAMPPPVTPLGGDVTLQIHESVLINAVSPVLAGRTLDRDKIADLVKQSGFSLPARSSADDLDRSDSGDLANEDADEPFEIDFARSRPIIFEARGGAIRVGVRGSRFAQGDRELKQLLEISATYRPVRQIDGTTVLVRQGTGKVDFVGKKRLSISQAGMRGTIEKRFAEVFPQELLTREFTVPSTVKLESLRGRQFRANQIDAQDGWMSVSAR